MSLLSDITLPGGQVIQSAPGFKSGEFTDLGSLLSGGLKLAFYLAAFLMVVWMIWGILEYILSAGKKEEIAKARGKIVWAIAGFIIVVMSFAVSQYYQEFFAKNVIKRNTPVTNITPP